MHNSEPVTGGCLCGTVRFEATKPLYDPHYCHCRVCQKASGGPVIAGAFVARDGFRFTAGEPRFYRSSPIVERGFCGDCGTYLMYRPLISEWADWIIITIVSLDRPQDLPPQRHYGIEGQIPWFKIHDDLPRERYEEGFIDILAGQDQEARAAILKRFGSS